MDTHDKLRDLLLNDSGFAFDPSTGFTYHISSSGMEVLRWIKEGLSESDILARLIEDYLVEPARAEHDLHLFMSSMNQYGLITA